MTLRISPFAPSPSSFSASWLSSGWSFPRVWTSLGTTECIAEISTGPAALFLIRKYDKWKDFPVPRIQAMISRLHKSSFSHFCAVCLSSFNSIFSTHPFWHLMCVRLSVVIVEHQDSCDHTGSHHEHYRIEICCWNVQKHSDKWHQFQLIWVFN